MPLIPAHHWRDKRQANAERERVKVAGHIDPAKHTWIQLKIGLSWNSALKAARQVITNVWSSICHITSHVTERKKRTSWWYEYCYFSFTWLHVKSHAAMTEISVSAFQVYCHPCHALFLNTCAYTATNWRQVRFKPMLLMGKNVWYVLALVPFLYLAQRPLCSCSSRSVCLCSHQTPLFSLQSACIASIREEKSLSSQLRLKSTGILYICGYVENSISFLWCWAMFSFCK